MWESVQIISADYYRAKCVSFLHAFFNLFNRGFVNFAFAVFDVFANQVFHFSYGLSQNFEFVCSTEIKEI